MATAEAPVVPGLIPEPREVKVLDGAVECGKIVNLIADGALASRVQAMTDVLASTGIEVDGGESAFRVDIELVGAGDLDASDVAETALPEYYELDLRAEGASIRALGADGALWGVHTLAAICRAAAAGHTVPQLRIRDWPDLANRGIFVEDKWGPDRMDLDDWCLTIDRLAALKMNRMGVGIYGCWGNCRYEDFPTEFLMVPVPGRPELKTEKNLKWYSPEDGAWHHERYLPTLFEGDFLADVVAYGRERGVTVIPFVNSLGHNTMIPRILPEVSAKGEDGTPLGIGYCLSSPKTREFIEGFYTSIIERYYPDGIDFFHIQLDEVWPDNADLEDPHKRVDPWCECPDCRSREREENLQAYIVWLVEMLTARGAKKVVMWNDQLTRHMDALDDSFVSKLRNAGLEDRLILHWWWYSNNELNDRTRVSIGTQLGLPGWVAPMTCYYNWERLTPRLENIDLMMQMAHDEGAEGAVSYAVHDPGWTDHEMLLASYAWHHDGVRSREDQLEKWATGRYGSDGAPFLEALRTLHDVADSPAISSCYNYAYTYCKEGKPFPRPYPGEALDSLEAKEGDIAPQLGEVAARAREAVDGFSSVAGKEIGDERDRACVHSLLGEAARIEGLATVFGLLLDLRKALSNGGVTPALLSRREAARALLHDCMATLEANKPRWVVPSCLQALSVLLAFMDQLERDLTEVQSGSRTPDAVRWQVEPTVRPS